jgi:hypothetical protein
MRGQTATRPKGRGNFYGKPDKTKTARQRGRTFEKSGPAAGRPQGFSVAMKKASRRGQKNPVDFQRFACPAKTLEVLALTLFIFKLP